jgi:uncharacterized membrane protein
MQKSSQTILFCLFFLFLYFFPNKTLLQADVLSEEHLIEQEQREEKELLSKITKKDSVLEKKSRGLLKKIKNTWGLPQVFFV